MLLCGRACGHFKEIVVSESGQVTCNCENNKTNGWCHDTLIFELIEFNKTPPSQCRDLSGLSWEKVRDGWKKKALSKIFSERDEAENDKNMYTVYLPAQDPLFGYASIVKSVPVPWVQSTEDENQVTLGVDMKVVGDPGKVTVVGMKPQSRGEVCVGDVILKLNNVTIASEDGALLNGNSLSSVKDTVSTFSKDKAVTMDVLRRYRK